MKKIGIIFVALCLVFVISGCKTTDTGGGGDIGGGDTRGGGRAVAGGVPEFVREILRNAPEDALIGIGSAKMATDSQSRTIATTRARAEISRQMSTMIQDMIRDYTAGSEVDHSAVLSFQENITVALSKAELVGSRVLDFDKAPDGTFWVVVSLGSSNVVNEINQAQSAAKLAVPAMASFNAEDRMNDAFAKAYASEIQVNSND